MKVIKFKEEVKKILQYNDMDTILTKLSGLIAVALLSYPAKRR